MKDQSFNGLAEKFNRNIYGTTKGRLRHQLLCQVLNELLAQQPGQTIIELGGGTGVMSAYLDELGHCLTLTDISEDVLCIARQQLAPRITVKQADLFAINDLANFDVVVCHAVLEWLAKPFDALTVLAERMRVGSKLSLTFFNRDAALFSNALYGNFDYIAKGMKVRNQVRLNPQQPLEPRAVIAEVQKLGFDVLKMRGIRCFHDYLRDRDMADSKYQALLDLEWRYGDEEPYLWLGKYFHLWLEKRPR